jgi:hypothetical protein
MFHLQAPGSAHDPAVKGLQFHFDYMNPRYPGVDTFMKVGRLLCMLLLVLRMLCVLLVCDYLTAACLMIAGEQRCAGRSCCCWSIRRLPPVRTISTPLHNVYAARINTGGAPPLVCYAFVPHIWLINHTTYASAAGDVS